MNLTQTVAQLSSRAQLLAERFSMVSEQLAATAREMAAGGDVPTVALSDELDVVRAEFAEVRRLTQDLAGAVGTPVPSSAQLTSLSVLQSLVQSTSETIHRRAAEEARQAALDVLEQVRLLRHREDPDYQPLREAQASADELRTAISAMAGAALSEDVASLAEERHPLGYLVEFARPQPDLDDARWELMHDAIGARFRRPLAVAAARGKLVIGGTVDEDLSFSQPLEDFSQRLEDEYPTLTVEAPPPIARLAVEPTSIEDLVWWGLLDDRPAVAFQLAYQLGPRDTASGCPPEWLLRALALSPYLLHVNGDLALHLTDAFAQFEAADLRLGADTSDGNRAVRLLLRAAALRPSLLAPDTGAWNILGALPAEPGFAQFHRYSQVISEYGERHPPLSPYAFAPVLSADIWRDNLEDLLREIGTWRVRFLGMRSSFPPARDVWRAWLRPDGLVHALLAPLTLDPRGLETARGLAERLSNAAQVRWEIGHMDRHVLGRTNGPDITTQPAATHDLSERVREAVAFARRWISLQENRPGRPEDEPLRQAKRLQHELSELRPQVVRELKAADEPGAALPLRAAVAQCLATISSIDALLGTPDARSSNAGHRREEPPPSLLLYRDLLRIPGLQLDEQGHPRGIDSARLVPALEGMLLRDDQPTWQEAFEAHLRRHDHAATAWIIQCIEIDEDARRLSHPAGLESARADDLQRCRGELRRQIELTRERVDAAAAHGSLSDLERGQLLASVELAAVGFATVLQFEPEFARLQRVRDQVPEPVNEAQPEDDQVRGGRVRERLELAAPDGPRFLVGAPGMGTSELFQLMAEAHSGAGQGSHTLVVDLATDASRRPDEHETDSFWRLAGDSLHDPARQLLLLVDGADALLEDEAQLALQAGSTPDVRTLFPTSSRLAKYMQESHGHLKVVLGGSVTALRAARLPQHPLSGRGWVQLGPLLDGGDWREARVLLRQVLEDVEPESDAILARILSLANYEPASISRLAGVLAEQCRGATVTDLKLDQLTSSRDGARVLTETLQATLACDPRFGVVLYSLALAYVRGMGSASSAGADGVSAAWLREQALTWWPEGFSDSSSLDAFSDVLDEMVALGVLRALRPDQFVPARPNLLQFLGSEEEIIGRLQALASPESEDADAEHGYAPAWFRPHLAGGLAGRSPLTNQQLSVLLAPATGCVIVFGTEAGGLLSLPRIGGLAGTGSPVIVTLEPPPGASAPGALLAAIDVELAQQDARVPVVMFVAPTWSWSGDWVPRVHDHLARVAVGRVPFARVVFIADPATTLRLVEHPAGGAASALALLTAQGVRCIALAPWRDTAVLQWLTESRLGVDQPTLSDVTGNWPLLLEACCPDGARPVASAEVWLREIEMRVAAGIDAPLAGAFGLDLPLGSALQQLAALGESQDIDIGSEALPTTLEWASLLHLVRPVGANRWRLDPVVARLLQPTTVRGGAAPLLKYR